MDMKMLLPIAVPICIIASIIAFIYSKRKQYNKWLNTNKARYKYQTMKLDVLIKIYEAIDGNDFVWDYVSGGYSYAQVHLLWYRIPRDYYNNQYFVIDMSWISCVLFRLWEKSYRKRQKEAEQETAKYKNSTNDVLQNIQKKLDTQIQLNCQQMKNAATQQGQVLSRLQGMEE